MTKKTPRASRPSALRGRGHQRRRCLHPIAWISSSSSSSSLFLQRPSSFPSLAPLVLLLLALPFADGCTTIAVGRLATSDGSVLSSHSNDGEGTTDPRLVLIPSSTWPANSTRKVFYSPESFPRYVGTDRANDPIEAYEPGKGDNADEAFVPICEIPQVERTYRYAEETYGALNERQLGISESTCSGVFGAAPKGIHYPGYGLGKACFSIDALSQIAMERHHNARDAIMEMGELAVKYGFYGAGLFEGTAESLIVTDTKEAWIFHILPDPTGASAIWAARRVPDDSFAVVPNVFIIREIDTEDEENYMYSDTVHSVAQQLKWWDPTAGKPLDFTAVYSDGEYSHKYYSGRRSWGVYQMFAPSLELSAEYEEWRISDPYPFAARPDEKLGVEDVARAMRTFYEETPYSQAGGSDDSDDDDRRPKQRGEQFRLARGPWGNPDHVSGTNSTPTSLKGNWERTVGLYRTSDSYVTQSRSFLPDEAGGVLWYGAYAAPYTTYVPFAAGMESLPDVTLGHHLRLDKNTLFWANRYVGNYVQLKWEAMMGEVRDFQRTRMEESLELQRKVDGLLLAALDNGSYEGDGAGYSENVANAMELYSTNAVDTVAKTWDLADHLMFKYADGQIHNTPNTSPLGTNTHPRTYDSKGNTIAEADVVDQPGYPAEWLEAVGFSEDGPPPPPDCKELGWRCGHKPRHGTASEGGGVRGGNDDGRIGGEDEEKTKEIETTETEVAWGEYVRIKEEAAGMGRTACGSRGDVAAALLLGGSGRSSCDAAEAEGADAENGTDEWAASTE